MLLCQLMRKGDSPGGALTPTSISPGPSGNVGKRAQDSKETGVVVRIYSLSVHLQSYSRNSDSHFTFSPLHLPNLTVGIIFTVFLHSFSYLLNVSICQNL